MVEGQESTRARAAAQAVIGQIDSIAPSRASLRRTRTRPRPANGRNPPSHTLLSLHAISRELIFTFHCSTLAR